MPANPSCSRRCRSPSRMAEPARQPLAPSRTRRTYRDAHPDSGRDAQAPPEEAERAAEATGEFGPTSWIRPQLWPSAGRGWRVSRPSPSSSSLQVVHSGRNDIVRDETFRPGARGRLRLPRALRALAPTDLYGLRPAPVGRAPAIRDEANRLTLRASIVNRASYAQPLPLLRLTLPGPLRRDAWPARRRPCRLPAGQRGAEPARAGPARRRPHPHRRPGFRGGRIRARRLPAGPRAACAARTPIKTARQ